MKIFIYLLSLLVAILSSLWLFFEPSFEPLIISISSIITLSGLGIKEQLNREKQFLNYIEQLFTEMTLIHSNYVTSFLEFKRKIEEVENFGLRREILNSQQQFSALRIKVQKISKKMQDEKIFYKSKSAITFFEHVENYFSITMLGMHFRAGTGYSKLLNAVDSKEFTYSDASLSLLKELDNSEYQRYKQIKNESYTRDIEQIEVSLNTKWVNLVNAYIEAKADYIK